MMEANHKNRAILVAALGYFVDVYDLLLFSIVRVTSLRSIGVPEEQLLDQGLFLLNIQMAGLLLGGFLWGIFGDKYGRVRVLFGSIILYSVANLLNAAIQNVEQYAIFRFIAGIGLAGELGAGITLVSELLSKEKRGWATALVATVGVAGGAVAALSADFFDWRTCYVIGGVLGLALLVLRVSVHESGMFRTAENHSCKKGNLRLLLSTGERVRRYLSSILVGVPIWFIVGILITFSPELGKAIGMAEAPLANRSVLFAYLGFTVGDAASGALSQLLRSRRKAIGIFIGITFLSTIFLLTQNSPSLTMFYTGCFLLGFGGGYWAVFVTSAAEQFGTNLRATVTTSVPNLVRATVLPVSFIFKSIKVESDILTAAFSTSILVTVIAVVALMQLHESFGRDLDFVEE